MNEITTVGSDAKHTVVNWDGGIRAEGFGAFIPQSATRDDVFIAMKGVLAMTAVGPWWIGDMYDQAKILFSEEMSQIVDMLGVSMRTLENYSSMSRSFPLDQRESASYSHHEVVRSLTPNKRRRYLEEADVQDMSVSRFRRFVTSSESAGGEGLKAPQESTGYVLAKVRRPFVEQDLDVVARESMIRLSSHDLMGLGIEPISDENYVYVVVAEKASMSITNEVLVCEDEPVVPKMEDDNNEISDNALAEKAIECILETKRASMSMLQRRFKLNHLRAVRLMDQLEDLGIIGPSIDGGARDIMISASEPEEESGVPAFM